MRRRLPAKIQMRWFPNLHRSAAGCWSGRNLPNGGSSRIFFWVGIADTVVGGSEHKNPAEHPLASAVRVTRISHSNRPDTGLNQNSPDSSRNRAVTRLDPSGFHCSPRSDALDNAKGRRRYVRWWRRKVRMIEQICKLCFQSASAP